MSNFFTNLTTRSFSPANLLQPKLPSLFETPEHSEPILEDSLITNAHHEETTEAVPVSPTVNRSRFEKYSARENERGTPPPVEPGPQAPESQRLAPQTILPFPPKEQPYSPTRIQSEERIVTVHTIRAENRPEEQKQAIGPRLAAMTQSPRKNDIAESSPGIASRVIPLIPKLEPSRSIPQAEGNLNEKIFPSEDKSPTVHIHIGQIEVRAVTQPSVPTRSVAPSQPKMTLDEYLLRRNEGKR